MIDSFLTARSRVCLFGFFFGCVLLFDMAYMQKIRLQQKAADGILYQTTPRGHYTCFKRCSSVTFRIRHIVYYGVDDKSSQGVRHLKHSTAWRMVMVIVGYFFNSFTSVHLSDTNCSTTASTETHLEVLIRQQPFFNTSWHCA